MNRYYLYKDIKLDIEYGSITIEHSPMIKDSNGCYKIGPSRIIRRDENGIITSDEFVEPAVQLVYEEDIKKWWEFWK